MSFLKQTASTFGTQILLMISGMAAGIIVARLLGPELKGQAALLGLVAQALFMVCSMGMGSAFSYFIARKRFEARQIMTAAMACSVLFGSVGLILFYGTLPLHRSVWSGIPMQLLFLSSILALGYIYTGYISRILVGYGRIYEMNAGDLTRSLVNLLATIAFVWIISWGVAGYLAAQFAALIAQTLLIMWFLRRDLRPTPFWREGLVREGFSYGLKSHALLLINFLNYRVDMLLLKHFADDTAVGYYSLAVGMAELMWLVPNAAVAPLFAEVAQSEAADRSVMTLRTVRWSLIFLLVLTVAGILLGRPFISLLYGREFLPSFLPFLGLLPGICLFPIFKLLTVDLAARGYPGYGTIASAVALVTNVVANVLLIPKWGTLGAALSTSISYSCMALISLIFFKKNTGFSIGEIIIVRKSEVYIIYNKCCKLMNNI